MTTFTRIAAAAVLATAFAAGAQAQQLRGPHVVGTGENASVVYDEPSQNIVGGALVRSIGSGEGARTETVAVEHAQAPHPVLRVITRGDNVDIVYADPTDAPRVAQLGG